MSSQKIVRCPTCEVALWSHYGGADDKAAFIRAGTLEDPDACPPDVHIFTRSKLPWFRLPPDKPAFEAFYKIPEVWPAVSQERLRRNIAGQS